VDLLSGESISLRALEPEDLELLYQWENDPTVWLLSGTMAPFSRYVLKRYLENAGKDIFELKQLRLVIQLHATNRALGAIDLFDYDPFHRRAGIGILIAEPGDRRKGYAQEALFILRKYAFDVMKLRQLWCNIAASNTASIELFTKSGFHLIGEKKDWLFTGEGFESELLFQLVNTP
jgi:diamine N-acetyltransferase